jgi:3-polyprenyl-4-hydroxybenzoate decarboxylase
MNIVSMIKGAASISSVSVIRKIIGDMKSMVMRLSRKAEKRAVMSMSENKAAQNFALLAFITHTAENVKKPLSLRNSTIIIIPKSMPKVSKLMIFPMFSNVRVFTGLKI